MLIEDSNPPARTVYERQLAGRVGAAYAVAFSYARTALGAILTALGIGPGDQVVLSPLTCKVVPLTLLSLKITPVYADISPETLNLSPQTLRSAIGPATRAILFQHTYGNPGGVQEAAAIASAHSLPLIEDCAQCLPETYDGQAPGSAGAAAVFSNNLLKPLPAACGGAATTSDPALSKELRRIASLLPASGGAATGRLRLEAWIHRRFLHPEFYWTALGLFERISPGYRERALDAEIASEISSAASVPSNWQMREGVRWLGRAGELARHRTRCCEDYLKLLGPCSSLRLAGFERPRPLYYFPVRTRRKKEVLAQARRCNIEMIAWPRSTAIYPLESDAQLRRYGFDPAACPVATAMAGELIGLPAHGRITARHCQDIVNLLRSYS